ncbi:MAG TPA: hypothetical protein VF166_01470 [Gemmatimonadaceae bacterium]
MITHIDLNAVLRRTVCDLFSDLVTRPTGVAVRGALERQLANSRGPLLTIIDFSNVGLLDFSCADEIVAKLLLHYCTPRMNGGPTPMMRTDANTPHPHTVREIYFLLSGVGDSHLDAIEAVLERHGLASVARDHTGAVMLLGTVDDQERLAWKTMYELGRAAPADLAQAAGFDLQETLALLDTLCGRGLAMRFDEAYVAVGAMQ